MGPSGPKRRRRRRDHSSIASGEEECINDEEQLDQQNKVEYDEDGNVKLE